MENPGAGKKKSSLGQTKEVLCRFDLLASKGLEQYFLIGGGLLRKIIKSSLVTKAIPIKRIARENGFVTRG